MHGCMRKANPRYNCMRSPSNVHDCMRRPKTIARNDTEWPAHSEARMALAGTANSTLPWSTHL